MSEALIIGILSFVGALVASGGATAVVQHHLEKKGKKAKDFETLNSKVDTLQESVGKLDAKIDMNEAQTARTQILRFADELYNGVLHTKEHFNEVLDTCGRYNAYCAEHPEFKNMRTVNAQERINEVYKKCERDHTFLDGEGGMIHED